MSKKDIELLDLLASINKFERVCQNLETPDIVFKLIGDLRNHIAKWGVEPKGYVAAKEEKCAMKITCL